MKNFTAILSITLLITAGCGNKKKQDINNKVDEIITVDVTKTDYPKKELILQDIMDVEYLALETNNDFLNQGEMQDIGEKYILVKNKTRDGNIFIYDRNGKAIRKINRKGQGPEEYTDASRITLDESNDEMFVNDLSKIIVYDLHGNFKRSFNHKDDKENGSLFYTEIFNYDKDNLICYDMFNKEISFVLISKQDGSITKEIKIPFQEKKDARATKNEGKMTYITGPAKFSNIIPHKGNFLLLEISSDTVFTLLPDFSLRPFIVRTPPVNSMDPEVFLIFGVMTDRYYFMETIKNVYDWNTGKGFPKTRMMYDNQEKGFFNCYVYVGDYTDKVVVIEDMSVTKSVNHEIDSWHKLEAHELVEAYKNGELKGKLKEIASILKEDDNPVIMLLKHKK